MAVEVTLIWPLVTSGGMSKVTEGGLYIEVTEIPLMMMMMISTSSLSVQIVLSTDSPLRIKIALPYWLCGISRIRIMPEMQGRNQEGPQCIPCRQRTSQLCWMHRFANISCLVLVRPSMLDDMHKAGPDKDLCFWPWGSLTILRSRWDMVITE